MTAREAMLALGAGTRPKDRLLGSCRLEWAGAEAFGEEAILEAFRESPFEPGEDATLVETRTAAALIGRDKAMFADLYDGRIGRLWRLGPGDAPEPEPALAVAFDPDLRQDRGGVQVWAGDHPDLAASAVDAVMVAGEALLAHFLPYHRARALCIRAFSAGGSTAALFAVHRLGGGQVREAGFGYAAALIGKGDPVTLRDQSPSRPWTTRL